MAVGLVLRLVVCCFTYGTLLDPKLDYWEFGWETGRIAHSIAQGHGFASPLFGAEGPTAWMAPLYPYLLAVVFRVCGSFTAASAMVILGLNSLFSVATCIPVYLIGERIFDPQVGRWAAWAWALYPYAVYFAATHVWETCLTTFLFSVALWMTLILRDGARFWVWLLYGVLWAATALTSPAPLVVLPVLMAWVAYPMFQEGRGRTFLLPATAAGLIFVFAVSPWFVRNYQTFHRFLPFRDNLWLEFHVGNNGDTSDVYIDAAHPAHSSAELQQYRSLGELAYFQAKKVEVLDFIRRHRAMYLELTVRRIAFAWTGFWSFRHEYLANEPFEIPNIVVSTILLILMLAGIRRAWHNNVEGLVPLVLCLVLFPVIYYLTHMSLNYRQPIDPIIVILAVCAIVSRRKAESPLPEEAVVVS
jgi:4-amino-4-deoxy-L-arabinose transferase-like glycosyltransferase